MQWQKCSHSKWIGNGLDRTSGSRNEGRLGIVAAISGRMCLGAWVPYLQVEAGRRMIQVASLGQVLVIKLNQPLRDFSRRDRHIYTPSWDLNYAYQHAYLHRYIYWIYYWCRYIYWYGHHKFITTLSVPGACRV